MAGRAASLGGAPRRYRLGRLGFILGLILVGLALVGCGSSDPQTETASDLTESVTAAEQQTAGAPSPQNPSEFISLCANCHDRLDTPLAWRQERKLVFNHSAHFSKGIRCVACHEEFPHKPGKTIHVPVDTCFKCHGTMHGEQGSLAPTDCDTCHTRDIAKITPDHSRKDWVLVSNGKAQHSEQGKERPLYCRMCHEPTFCAGCHKVEMPHPADWTKAGHQPIAAKDRSSCSRCHPEKNFCNDCHHKSLPKLADWAEQHKTVAGNSGPATSCYTCHKPPFCSACHVRVGKQRGTLGQ